MIVFSNAKINLGLRVLNKRPDGFHNISGIFYPVPLYDFIEFSESSFDEIRESGFITNADLQNNLIYKTILLLRKSHAIPRLRIFVHKQIPVGAGLGGGSSNAASTLLFLNNYFKLQLSENELYTLALKLGSDVPFFLFNRPCYVEGRGEMLSPIQFSLRMHYVLIVFTGLEISTQLAFAKLARKEVSTNYVSLNNYDFDGVNDFETGLLAENSVLSEIKAAMLTQGALYASLSGSGSAIFGIFNQKPNISIWRKYYFCRLLYLNV